MADILTLNTTPTIGETSQPPDSGESSLPAWRRRVTAETPVAGAKVGIVAATAAEGADNLMVAVDLLGRE